MASDESNINQNFGRILIASLITSTLILSSMAIVTSNSISSSWPMIDGDAQGTRRSPFSAQDNEGQVMWTYGQYVRNQSSLISELVTGPGGTIYFWERVVRYTKPYSEYIEESYLVALNDNGEVKWKKFFPTGGGGSILIGNDGTIYTTLSVDIYGNNYSFILTALTRSGDTKWNFELQGSPLSPITMDGSGRIYVLVGGYYAQALEVLSSNGDFLWSMEIHEEGQTYTGAPTIGANGTVYIVIGYHAYAITRERILWRTDFHVQADTLRIDNEGTIYFKGAWEDSSPGALNPDSSLKWRYEPDNWVSPYTPVIGPDGTLYTYGREVESQIELRAINPDGSDKWVLDWSLNTSEGYWYLSAEPVVSADGTIFLGGCGSFMAINPNGTLKWANPILWPAGVYDIIIGQNGAVYGTIINYRSFDAYYSLIAFGPATIKSE